MTDCDLFVVERRAGQESLQQLERDAADCQFKAKLSSLAELVAGNTEQSGARDLEQMCMNRKGYYQPEKRP